MTSDTIPVLSIADENARRIAEARGMTEWFNIEELEVDADEVYIMWQPRQLVMWPMRLHVHDQECYRS